MKFKTLFLVFAIILSMSCTLSSQNFPWLGIRSIVGSDSTFSFTDLSDPSGDTQIIDDSTAYDLLTQLAEQYAAASQRRFLEFKQVERAVRLIDQHRESLLPASNGWSNFSTFSREKYNGALANESFTGEYASNIRIGQDTTFNIEVYKTAGGNQVFRIEDENPTVVYPLNFVEGNVTIRAGSVSKLIPVVNDIIEFRLVRQQNNRAIFWGELASGKIIVLNVLLPEQS